MKALLFCICNLALFIAGFPMGMEWAYNLFLFVAMGVSAITWPMVFMCMAVPDDEWLKSEEQGKLKPAPLIIRVTNRTVLWAAIVMLAMRGEFVWAGIFVVGFLGGLTWAHAIKMAVARAREKRHEA